MSSALGIWKCHECSMTFTSPGLLAKHKSKFCPGNTVSRTTRILDFSPRPESPELQKQTCSIGEKVSELQALKDRRSRMREVRDLEERVLLDKLDNTERKLNAGVGKHNKGRLHLSHHKDVRQLQIDYERLREREHSYPTGRHSTFSMNSDSSMSIHLPDEGDIPRRNPDPELAQLAASHGRQMEMLQGRNKDLERQREEIRRRLEELGRKPVREEDPSNSLLDELREQELRNQRLLEELRRQLAEARQPINIIDINMLSRNEKLTSDLLDRFYKMMRKERDEKYEKILSRVEVGVQPSREFWIEKEPSSDMSSSLQEKASGTEETDSLKCITNVANQHESDMNTWTVSLPGSNTRQKTHPGSVQGMTHPEAAQMSHPHGDQKQPFVPALGWRECLTAFNQRGQSGVPHDVTSYGNECVMCKGRNMAGQFQPGFKGYRDNQIHRIAEERYEQKQKQPFTYPIYYGSSLVAEISAIRQAYIQNGGQDPEVLAQLAQMLAEAQAIEDQLRNAPKQTKVVKEKKTSNEYMHSMMALEMENERMQRELMLLQEQNMLARNRRKDDREDELEREIRRLQQEHLRRMYELQREIERIRQEHYLHCHQHHHEVVENPTKVIIAQAPPPPPQIIQQAAAPPQIIQQPQVVQQPQQRYMEVEQVVPYDQYAGFVIFYDFLLNLDTKITAARLIVGLHSSTAKMGEPTYLPMVYTEPATRQHQYVDISNAVIGARQPVPRCPPHQDLGIVVELQCQGGPASDHDTQRLITRAWTKIPLFDSNGKLQAGRFKIPFRNVPIKPFMTFTELNTVPPYADAELFYRIVHMRDVPSQSQSTIAANNRDLYSLAPQGGMILHQLPVSPHQIPPPPSASPPLTPNYHSPRRSSRQQEIFPPIRSGGTPLEPTLGFQVDRIKHADSGEGKVRLTAYYKSTGKVVQSSTSPVTCSTTAVRSNFKHGYHVFGQQEATFQDVAFQGDMILIARFYLRKKLGGYVDDLYLEPHSQEASLYDEEALIAWTAIPLVISHIRDLSSRERREFNPALMRINNGTHTLKLFAPPVPEASRLPLEDFSLHDYKRYGRGSLRIHIFHGNPRPGSLTPSDISDDQEDNLPEYAWLPYERKNPPTEPFMAGDGFDVYIDGCRYLPDSVTFSKVAGRILDRRYDVHGKDISTGVKLDSDSYNPVYEHKEEYRLPTAAPSSTLLLKIYTMDKFYKKLTVVGYATLNLFVESGSERQPAIDRQGLQVSLNTGAHQLRVYNQGPNGVDPFSDTSMRTNNTRFVPCTSMLVRITKVPKGPQGKPLECSKVPQADWLRLGLWQPRPKYSDRIYYSMKCLPTKGESKLFHSLMKRTPISVRQAVARNTQAKDSFLRSDKNMEQYIRNQLTKSMDTKPLEQDLNFIAEYSPKHGVKVALDSAVNLPWSNFTHCHMCLNPPGAFYLGTPHATYDKLTFTENLDLRSTNTSPAWRDGFKHFPRRSYHRFLTAVIHLQEVFVTVSRDNYKYGLLEQAWTAVQMFKDKYAYTTTFQLPLFAGSPSPQMLKQMAREPCREWMERNIRNNTIKLIEGASIFVRVSDGRREDELITDIPTNKLVEINMDYIPNGVKEQYSRERPGRPTATLVPTGKSPEQFIEGLSTKFKSLVYKLYEEGNISKN
ncbi:uncharacterized protein LOC124111997 isoform X2 [Haliotis rufescens]|uniref:uncharacterized protein LOC124111997 isoform X2 n=1 Tax=Haliotis rufescens TaxID=6454 RepID=UPI00201F2E03|nr:uncharacterized protein LOC124111997 isoform X2 [Haliotis rufescens]